MRFYKLALVIACGSALQVSAALAQDVSCATTETQIEMNACAEQDWLAADETLNEVYADARSAMRQIDAGLEKDQVGAERYLRDGQRAWVTFRDATCAAEGYMMYGGSAEPMVIYGCRARLTDQRVEDLTAMAQGY